MTKLSDLALRILHPANYRFASDVVQARAVRGTMLEDHVIDFERFKPEHRASGENDFLQLNDVVIGITGYPTVVNSVGIYSSAFPCPEAAATLSSHTLAFRMANLLEAISALASILYRLSRRRETEVSEIRALPIELLTDDQVVKFSQLIKTVHDMKTNMRKRNALMGELIPATVGKFYKDNKERELEEKV